jgi:hypothetical protein
MLSIDVRKCRLRYSPRLYGFESISSTWSFSAGLGSTAGFASGVVFTDGAGAGGVFSICFCGIDFGTVRGRSGATGRGCGASTSTAGGGVGSDTIVFSSMFAAAGAVGFGWIGDGSRAKVAADDGAGAASEVESSRYATNPTVLATTNASTTPTMRFIIGEHASNSIAITQVSIS